MSKNLTIDITNIKATRLRPRRPTEGANEQASSANVSITTTRAKMADFQLTAVKTSEAPQREALKSASPILEFPQDAPEWLKALMDQFRDQFRDMEAKLTNKLNNIPNLVAEKFDEKWRLEKEELKASVTEVDRSLNAFKEVTVGRLDKLTRDLEEAKGRIAELEDVCMDNVELLGEIVEDREKEKDWREDQESRGRRCNIRVHGLAEGVEGRDMKKFMETFIKAEFPQLGETDLKIQRCHRQLGPADDTRGPRSVVMYFLEFTTREAVLGAAWAKRGLSYDRQPVSFGYDYPPTVYKRIRLYKGLPKYLKDHGLKGKTDYLGKMKVTWADGTTTTYGDAAAVREGLTTKGYEELPDLPTRVAGRRPAGAFQRVGRSRTTHQEKYLAMRRRTDDIQAKKNGRG